MYEIHLQDDKFLTLFYSDRIHIHIYNNDHDEEFNQKDLEKIKYIRIYDKEKRWIEKFFVDTCLLDDLKTKNKKIRKKNKELKEKLKYYKSLSEI